TVLDQFCLLPLAVGQESAPDVAEVLELLWGGPETLIVVSSDLSHYLPYQTACAVDAQTCEGILALDSDIEPDRACGAFPLNGLLLAARHHHLQPVLLDLRNSGDTAGDKARVVGYSAMAFYENDRIQ
ncbi:MAG TPA: AmmeMemoRadiSam system protein B, partial [Rhodocyclaceae bacterium]|nr:AmmeMemoRadiSam system protein B [Rhodocyclaceae bacterium]